MHGFRVLQLPMNLFEAGALLTPNTGSRNTQTVLEFSQQEQIAVLANRPLNAIRGKNQGMIRLADPHTEPIESTFETQRDELVTLEEEFRKDFAPHLPYSGKGLEPKNFFFLTEKLNSLRPQLHSLEHWEQIESQMLAPHVNQALQVVTKQLGTEQATSWKNWQNRYIPKLVTIFLILRKEAAEKNRAKIKAITETLDPLLPKDKRSEPISRKAIWILASTPGVTCILNGMRAPRYVDDALAILNWEPLDSTRNIFESIIYP